jgi:acetylglutamate kinase
MVLCGKVNKDIVALIQRAGGRALGLCGLDGALLRARRVRGEDLGLVGEAEQADSNVIRGILDSGIIPVLSPVAYGMGEDEGRALNVNADTAAAFIAAAMAAEELVLMTDVRGILRDVRDQDSLIKTVKAGELEDLKKQGIVSKGMIPKTDCCRFALEAGVKKARIIDGRVKHSLLTALFTDESIGTEIEN